MNSKDNYLAVRISRDSEARWDKRIVMSSWKDDEFGVYPYLNVEWRTLDALDHESWNPAKYENDGEEAAALLLASVIICHLNAWPHWYPLARPKTLQSQVNKDNEVIHVCEIKGCTRRPDSPNDTDTEHIRILHSESRDLYHPDHPKRHFSRVEVAGEDGLDNPCWRYVGDESTACGRYDNAFSILMEVAITRLGMRFDEGDNDHRQNFYKAEVVP
ncbi:hypothetical protein LCGC14_1799780 [marine sediment metagenome]|uniref:Uncharacterized protein n=1 Tax=marine sediment metagenome TaxID=412755 RepID=A0A0F9J4S2_9ZZZZ